MLDLLRWKWETVLQNFSLITASSIGMVMLLIGSRSNRLRGLLAKLFHCPLPDQFALRPGIVNANHGIG
jgi:hypothetical protein